MEEQGLLWSPGEDRSQGESQFEGTKTVNETVGQLLRTWESRRGSVYSKWEGGPEKV